ncbi:MAG: hypothetical protein DRO62_02130 [Candidatus Altiarchaeales archaeon]|nr:MAG: hypothetical protein DRO62_02130 [Candidatus Altiarchaeales archaeon]
MGSSDLMVALIIYGNQGNNMSGYRVHITAYSIFISVLLAILYYFFDPEISATTLVIGFSIGILYSILPDIDAKGSKIRQLLAGVFLLCSVFYLLYPGLILGLMGIILAFFLLVAPFIKHRGFFHTITAGVLFSAPLFLVDPWFSFFALLGFLSHLAVDGRLFSLF